MSKKLRGNLIKKKKITKGKKENFIGKALGRKKFKSKKKRTRRRIDRAGTFYLNIRISRAFAT